MQIRWEGGDGQWVSLDVQVGDPSKLGETISKAWQVTAKVPEGTEASLLTKKITISIKPISKDKYDDANCFRSLEGVKLLRPAHV